MDAQGGAAALGATKTTVLKGEATHWEPGQSYAATGEARFLGDTTYTHTIDNAKRLSRIDWDRDMKYPAVERLKYSEITGPTWGVLIDENNHTWGPSVLEFSAVGTAVIPIRDDHHIERPQLILTVGD